MIWWLPTYARRCTLELRPLCSAFWEHYAFLDYPLRSRSLAALGCPHISTLNPREDNWRAISSGIVATWPRTCANSLIIIMFTWLLCSIVPEMGRSLLLSHLSN